MIRGPQISSGIQEIGHKKIQSQLVGSESSNKKKQTAQLMRWKAFLKIMTVEDNESVVGAHVSVISSTLLADWQY